MPRLRLVWLLAVSLLGAHARADAVLDRRIAIEQAMRRANAYYQANFALGSAVWNRGAYHAGNLRLWQTLGTSADLDYAVRWATANSWLVGPEAGGSADADSQACGQPYLDLYERDPQPVRKASIQARLDLLVANPAADDDWWWIDAFFMAGPTLARLARIEGNPAYFTQLEQMYAYMKSTHALFDPARGLWYRDATAKARTGANTPQFWGRGNGWVIAACARILEQLPPADPRRTEFATMLQTMAAALRPLQGADGFWRSNLLFPAHYPNPETSCTAFFTYALAYGVNTGLLDSATYSPVVDKAWDGLLAFALNPAGRLGYVQAIGAAPAANTADGQQDYGYGAFLLAGCEILRGLGGPAPVTADAGPDLSTTDADADFAATVRLDASASVIRDGTSPGIEWWLGSTRLGLGSPLDVALPLGDHAVSLVLVHADGRRYTDTLTVRVAPAPALAIAVNAIGYESGSTNVPANTLDGSLATRWSQFGTDQWIQWTLPLAATLNHVRLAFYAGDARLSFFDLQVSADGLAWETVFSGQSSGATTALETFSFAARPVRHVRYVGRGNSVSGWNSVTEADFSLAVLLDAADTDANGLPDAWEIHHYGATGQSPARLAAYISGEEPPSPDPVLRLDAAPGSTPRLLLATRAALGPGYVGKTRRYRVLTCPDLTAAAWVPLPDVAPITGDNVNHAVTLPAAPATAFYRAEIWLE